MALTPRQSQIIERIAFGQRDEEIARELGITVPTVAFHVKQILEELGASNRANAVYIYVMQLAVS